MLVGDDVSIRLEWEEDCGISSITVKGDIIVTGMTMAEN